jgi:hypothetical protein
MRTNRYAPVFLAASLCAAVPAAAQFGAVPGGFPEPSLFDQATGKASKVNFGPTEAYAKGSDPTFGDVLIRVRHVLDLSRLSRMAGGNIEAKDIENQAIEFRYPFDRRLDLYKQSGEEEKSKTLIQEIVGKPFLAAQVVSGQGKGVSLRRATDGKYVLWAHAPAAFGSGYEKVGLVVKGTDEFLFARNLRDDSVVVFLAPDKAERYYANGNQETLSATALESAMMNLPVLVGGIAGLLALVLGVVFFLKRRRPEAPVAQA